MLARRETPRSTSKNRDSTRRLRVAFAATSVSRAGGGVTPAMRDLSRYVASDTCEIEIVALEDQFVTEDSIEWPPHISIHTCRVIGPRQIYCRLIGSNCGESRGIVRNKM